MSEGLTDEQLDAIEATVLGPDGTAYGDDTLALVAEVRVLRDGVQRHRETANKARSCCDDCLAAGKEPWTPEHDTELWSLLPGDRHE